MSVTMSVPHCFDEAIALENVDAFRKTSQSVGSLANDMFDKCGTLRNAVYYNRTTMISEMLSAEEGANPDGGLEWIISLHQLRSLGMLG